jgi:hypothetical protein
MAAISHQPLIASSNDAAASLNIRLSGGEQAGAEGEDACGKRGGSKLDEEDEPVGVDRAADAGRRPHAHAQFRFISLVESAIQN